MPYPSGLPVDEQVMAALKTRLETITGTPSYHTRVKRVERYKPNNVAVIREFPAIVIGQPQLTETTQVAGRISIDLRVTIRAALEDRETFSTSLSWIAADIRKAIYSDVQLGGVACWTRIEGEERYLMIDEDGSAPALDINLLIHYRHTYDDPNTPA